MSGSYFPSNDDEVSSWAKNYQEHIEENGPAMGMTPEEVAKEKDYCDTIINSIAKVNTARASLKSSQDDRDNVLATVGGTLRSNISHHKTAPGYTNSIGETLKIVTHSPTVDFVSYKAKISTELFGGHIRIKFIKKGVEGINLYNRKKGSSDWNFVARATKSPFEHKFALEVSNQPEHWEYKAFGVVSDQEVGIGSNIVEIIFGG